MATEEAENGLETAPAGAGTGHLRPQYEITIRRMTTTVEIQPPSSATC